ncbi:putative flippase GtrA [Rhizobium sp. BK313]|uniref:GtrA family protein n=1 Tax=Rhizobium sp. BK313 TaxID=2587081 RepID=UPI001060ED58|nr:GtrA family protein [Rhizobium sp. BK313]MBB3457294.1 putative flippase GtrA [Rhizobium sp. BK313]
MNLLHDPRFQVIKYFLVGALTAALYFSVLFLTVTVLHLHHVVAVSISYFCAIAFHFSANKIFTFRSRSPKILMEALRYICLVVVNYIITLIVVYIVVDVSGQSTYLGVGVAVAVTVGLGYGVTKLWVFQHSRG